MPRSDHVQVAGVNVTSAHRVIYPDTGLTKAELADYIATVSPGLLEDIGGRLISLLRCPQGIGNEHFFQKHHAHALGSHVYGVPVREKGGEDAEYLHVDDVRGLVELVQMGTVEFHAWGALASQPDRPDRLVLDLDPAPGMAWQQVIDTALRLRALLADDGLDSAVRLTGGKGLHVVCLFAPGPDWAQVKALGEALAHRLADAEPDTYVASAAKEKRNGRIFIDWLRNTRGATSIANWSPRARPGAPAAVPLRWDELADTHSGHDYTLERALRRFSALPSSPWSHLDPHQAFPR